MTQTAELKTWQFESRSGKETIAVGHRIAALLVPPKYLILRGDLGAERGEEREQRAYPRPLEQVAGQRQIVRDRGRPRHPGAR